jgi:hypothetical protein
VSKAKKVMDVMTPLLEDKHDDHVNLLKLHPNVPDAIKRKLDMIRKQKGELETKHDQVYQALCQNPGDGNLKSQLDAIDQKLDGLNQWIGDQVNHHAGASK